ncbi:cholecystokinin receptor-like [Amphiura filiformis]|uniref:cholecystokinin receptor-like n=1 Tax=Amphiura filiformis TaxID=82378 RepID=UPI003B215975
MRSSTNYFLVNLCIADLMVLIFCIPSGLLETFKPMEWVLGPAMCYIVPFLENVTSQASILTLMAIAVERYYVIWRPLEVSYTCTPKRTFMVCLLVWLLASLCSIPPVIMVAYSSCEHWDGRIGHTCITYITSALGKSYVIGTTIVFFFLPCFFLTIVYALFANTLRKHDAYMNAIKDKETSTRLSDNNRIELSPVKSCNFKNNRYVKCATTPNDERKAEKDRLCGGEAYKRSPAVNHGDAFTASSRQTHRRVIYMLGSVVIVFFICWLPIRVMILWQIFASSEAFNRVGFNTVMVIIICNRIMLYINSSINPLLYNLISTKFRDAFKDALSCRKTNRGGLSRKIGSFKSYASNSSFRHTRTTDFNS